MSQSRDADGKNVTSPPLMIGRFNSPAGEVVGTAVMNGKPPTGLRKSEIPVLRRAVPLLGEDSADLSSKGRQVQGMEIPDPTKWTSSGPRLERPGAAHRRHLLPEPTPVKRCVGPVNEVSIVYRRPASPSGEVMKRQPIPLSPQVHIVEGGPKRAIGSPVPDSLAGRQAAIGLGARCLSPPSGAETEMSVVGVCCEHCNNCLIELKRQALRLMFPDNGINTGRLSKDPNLASRIAERLEVPQISPKFYLRDRCDVCDTHIRQLKQEAAAMVHSIQQAQCESAPPTNIPALVGSCNFSPVQRTAPSNGNNHNRQGRPSKIPYSSGAVSTSAPIAAQAQAYLEQNVRAWISPKRCNHMLSNRGAAPGQVTSLEAMNTIVMDQYLNSGMSPAQRSYSPSPGVGHPHPQTPLVPYPQGCPSAPSLAGSASTNPSAAASFFARAAQKLSISSKRKKKHHVPEPELPSFPTNFSEILRLSPPPAPPCLMRGAGRVQTPGAGKVKVMLRICPSTYSEQSASFLSVDPRKKQVTVFDPSHCGYASASQRKTGVPAPKMFAFDAVFCPDDSVTEICSSSLTEIVQAVVNGADGCLFSYGHARFGKSETIVGRDQSQQSLGVIPCAIAWLFKLINEQKEKTGARFSVRVSAVEVTGKQETLRDLLQDVAQGQETGVSTAPGVYLREDPICGTQLENQSELRAPTADKAAFYLDAALAARSIPDSEEEAKSAHLLFTLHVYQYRIEKSSKAGLPAVAGGRSRLHLIDLGSCSKSKDPNGVALSLSALGNVILALLNGQRHVPHRDSKIAQLLRDSLGNLSCRTCMIAHVTPSLSHHNESLQVIQLAARIHRMRRRKNKFSSTSSEESSCEESGRLRRYGVRGFRKMGTLREDVAMSHSDPDYTSSSEQSCDTVIYMGANGQSLSDRELTDGEGPPRHVPRTNPRLPSKSPRRTSGSKSSGDEGSNSDSRSSYSSYSDRGRFTRDDSLIKIGAVTRLPYRPASAASSSSSGAHSISVSSPPISPHHGPADGHQRKTGIRTTVTKPKCPSDSEDSSSLQSFGMKPEMAPSMPRTNGNLWYREKGENGPVEGEKWIDGPGAEIFPDSTPQPSERWVDGPGAYKSTKSSKSGRSEHRKHSKNPTVSADEKWVDGPTEMVVRQRGVTDNASVSSQSVVSQRKHDNKFGPSSRSVASEKMGKCSVTSRPSGSPKHVVVAEQERPTSMASVDSNVSLKVQTGDSRPVNSHTNSAKESALSKVADKVGAEEPGVKPFVRDWVERHAITSDNVPKADTLHCKTKRDPTSELPVMPKHSTMDRSQKSKVVSISPRHTPSPGGSPLSSRKNRPTRGHLQKSDLPPSSSPSTRVAEWVKSVSGTNGVTVQSGPKDSSADSRNEMRATKATFSSDISPLRLNGPDCAVESLKVNINGKEVACDLSTQSSSDIQENESDTPAVINRDSVYEMQFDEQLEVFKNDNETFSSISGSQEPQITEGHCELVAAMCSIGDRSLRDHLPSLSTCLEMSVEADLDSLDVKNTGTCPESVLASNKARLRCPDGASNPNLSLSSCEESPNKDDMSLERLKINPLVSNSSVICANVQLAEDKDYAMRSVDGQADDSGLIDENHIYSEIGPPVNETSQLLSNSDAAKPPIPQKPANKTKPSALPKLFSGSSKSNRAASASPARVSREEKSPLLSKTSPVVQSNKSNGQSSGHKSREKDKPCKSPKTGSQTSPTGSSSTKSGKSSKSQSPNRSKLPVFSSKEGKEKTSGKGSHRTFGFSKKDKEKCGSGKAGNSRVGELTGHTKGKGTDSDSGNDSGIVANERKKLLSPYATVTQPRTPSHSSSGHGSDNSSVISSDILSKTGVPLEKLQCGASSGYESMLRDSEATGTSSSTHEDTASECSSGDRTKGSKISKKRPSSTRRSRSAPARSPGSPATSKRDIPDSGGKGVSPSSKAWVDTRYIKKYKEEPFQIQNYDTDDIERLQKMRSQEGEPPTAIEERTERIRELLGAQTELKQELTNAKDTLLVDRSTWSFDCKLLLCFTCRSQKNETKT